MHTVELLEEALRAAEALGYQVRREWLGGVGGGNCEIKGRKHVFIDLSLSLPDQLQQALAALRVEPRMAHAEVSTELRRQLHGRRAA
ncbi:MAG TPA: hypothetical protein VF306_21160 [Pirellulales bacterium]